MEGKDELLTIAEIAIGLAGFSGIIAVFLSRDGLSFTDRVRFIVLFVTAFVALILSFLPIVLSYAGLSGPQLWQLVSTIMAIVWISGLIPFPFVRQRVQREMEQVSVGVLLLIVVPTAVNLLLQIANATALWWEPNFIACLIGLLLWLYAAAYFFVLIVLYRPAGGD